MYASLHPKQYYEHLMPNSLPLCIRSNHNAKNNLKDIVGLIFDLQEFVNTIFKCIEIELYSTRIVPSMLFGKMFHTDDPIHSYKKYLTS